MLASRRVHVVRKIVLNMTLLLKVNKYEGPIKYGCEISPKTINPNGLSCMQSIQLKVSLDANQTS